MNKKYLDQMNAELKAASSIAEMFEILGEYYDLENCKPGSITKMAMITALQKGVMLVNAKPKTIYQ